MFAIFFFFEKKIYIYFFPIFKTFYVTKSEKINGQETVSLINHFINGMM